jgi:hypothetical protein
VPLCDSSPHLDRDDEDGYQDDPDRQEKWPLLNSQIRNAIDAVARIAPAISSNAPALPIRVGSTRLTAMTSATMTGGLTRTLAAEGMRPDSACE